MRHFFFGVKCLFLVDIRVSIDAPVLSDIDVSALLLSLKWKDKINRVKSTRQLHPTMWFDSRLDVYFLVFYLFCFVKGKVSVYVLKGTEGKHRHGEKSKHVSCFQPIGFFIQVFTWHLGHLGFPPVSSHYSLMTHFFPSANDISACLSAQSSSRLSRNLTRFWLPTFSFHLSAHLYITTDVF